MEVKSRRKKGVIIHKKEGKIKSIYLLRNTEIKSILNRRKSRSFDKVN